MDPEIAAIYFPIYIAFFGKVASSAFIKEVFLKSRDALTQSQVTQICHLEYFQNGCSKYMQVWMNAQRIASFFHVSGLKF